MVGHTGGWDDIVSTLYVSSIMGGVLLTLFELLRGRKTRFSRALYRQRHTKRYRQINARLSNICMPPYPRGLFLWIPDVCHRSDAEFLELAGLDGYVTLRFIRLCKRLCLFACFWGLLVLVPVYYSGGGGAVGHGYFALTMTNLPDGDGRLWLTVVAAWLFAGYLLYALRNEYKVFSGLRNTWLQDGDCGVMRQTSYSVMVEKIPRRFRSAVVLRRFLDTLFPGQVHSATVCLDLKAINGLLRKQDAAAQKLEAAVIRRRHKPSKSFSVGAVSRLSYPAAAAAIEAPGDSETRSCCGRKRQRSDSLERHARVLAGLSQTLRPLQESKLRAALIVEDFKRKELRDAKKTYDSMAAYFSELLLADERSHTGGSGAGTTCVVTSGCSVSGGPCGDPSAACGSPSRGEGKGGAGNDRTTTFGADCGYDAPTKDIEDGAGAEEGDGVALAGHGDARSLHNRAWTKSISSQLKRAIALGGGGGSDEDVIDDEARLRGAEEALRRHGDEYFGACADPEAPEGDVLPSGRSCRRFAAEKDSSELLRKPFRGNISVPTPPPRPECLEDRATRWQSGDEAEAARDWLERLSDDGEQGCSGFQPANVEINRDNAIDSNHHVEASGSGELNDQDRGYGAFVEEEALAGHRRSISALSTPAMSPAASLYSGSPPSPERAANLLASDARRELNRERAAAVANDLAAEEPQLLDLAAEARMPLANSPPPLKRKKAKAAAARTRAPPADNSAANNSANRSRSPPSPWRIRRVALRVPGRRSKGAEPGLRRGEAERQPAGRASANARAKAVCRAAAAAAGGAGGGGGNAGLNCGESSVAKGAACNAAGASSSSVAREAASTSSSARRNSGPRSMFPADNKLQWLPAANSPPVQEVKARVAKAGKWTARELTRHGGRLADGVAEVAGAVRVLTVGSMSATGFVTFKTLTARACAVQTRLCNVPHAFELKAAPESRDIRWEYVTSRADGIAVRRRVVTAILLVGVIFWGTIVSGIYQLSQKSTLAKIFPFYEQLAAEKPVLASVVSGYLPVLLLLLLLQNLYFIFKHLANLYEGYKSCSEVEIVTLTRYFWYNVVNVFVTSLGGSVLTALKEVNKDPAKILSVLGDSVPEASVLFTNLVIVKVIGGLMMELCFGGRPLKFWRIGWQELFHDPELRTRAQRTSGAFEPSEPWYGRFCTDFLLVVLIVLTYQVMAPVVAVTGLCYFVIAEGVYSYNLCHCYSPLFESGGRLSFALYRHLGVSAVVSQVALLGYMATKAVKQGPFLLPLPFIVAYYCNRWNSEGLYASDQLSLDKAQLQDQEEQLQADGGNPPIYAFFDDAAYMQPPLRAPAESLIARGRFASNNGPSNDGEESDSDVENDGLLMRSSRPASPVGTMSPVSGSGHGPNSLELSAQQQQQQRAGFAAVELRSPVGLLAGGSGGSDVFEAALEAVSTALSSIPQQQRKEQQQQQQERGLAPPQQKQQQLLLSPTREPLLPLWGGRRASSPGPSPRQASVK